MANLEIIALNTATPQLSAPLTGNQYIANRSINISPEAGSPAIKATSGNIGVGTPTPDALLFSSGNAAASQSPGICNLHVVGADNVSPRITMDAAGSSGSVINTRSCGGTLAAPSAVTAGFPLFNLSVSGYGATAYGGAAARMLMYATQNFTDTAQGAYISFVTTPTGSVTPTEAFRVQPSGGIGAGNNPQDLGAGSVVAQTVIQTGVYTVATLPSTGPMGMVTGARAIVSNAASPTFGATVVGGGAVVTPVFYNGANWTVG